MNQIYKLIQATEYYGSRVTITISLESARKVAIDGQSNWDNYAIYKSIGEIDGVVEWELVEESCH